MKGWHKRSVRRWLQWSPDPEILQILLLGGSFLLGLIVGPVLGKRVLADQAGELGDYLQLYLSLEQNEVSSFLRYLFLYFCYPALAVLAGMLPLGRIFLSLLSFAQGFFLSYAAACFASLLGRQGILLAMVGFGLRVFVTLPCFFYLALRVSRTASGQRRGKGKSKSLLPIRLWPLAVCVLLFLAALLDYSMAPVLLRIIREIF